MIKKVYIAGPMRGYPEFNFAAFDAAKKRGAAKGFECISPADLDRASGFDATGLRGADEEFPRDQLLEALRRDFDALAECDAIALLPGWENSRGAIMELMWADLLRLEVLDARDFFPLLLPAPLPQLFVAKVSPQQEPPKQYALPFPDTPRTGIKHDSGKPQFSLIDPRALFGLAKVLTYGAQKYAPRNWENGMRWSRVFDAAMRHLWAWWQGEQNDPESGLPHLDHALCCVHFLSAYEKRNFSTFDDRPHGLRE